MAGGERREMKVTIVGLGMGHPDTMTAGVRRALEEARLVIGARRVLESLPETVTARRIPAVAAEDIRRLISENEALSPVCVAMSGDTGFYSGTAKLLALLEGAECLPGLTTVQYLAAKLGRPWQEVRLFSAHGRTCNIVGSVLAARDTFFLTDGVSTPAAIARALCAADLGDAELTVGERLSYPDERITSAPAVELTETEFDPLSAVWVRCTAPRTRLLTGGLPDAEFLRGEVPMTKQEVRAAVLARLRPAPGETFYDVGAGTGSVGIELALLDPMARVFAVECLPEACDLIRANRKHFGAYNLMLAEGTAPAALSALPAPDAAFVGGSRGNLAGILDALQKKNPRVRVAVSAIALETLDEALRALEQLGFENVEISQISVSRAREAGRYHMMTGLNPIFLLSGQGAGA